MYNLTKAEITKYKKEFNKCHIGKTLWVETLICSVVFIFIIAVGILFGSGETIDAAVISLFAFSIFTGMGALCYESLYTRELSHYIREQLDDKKHEKK